MDTHSWGGGFGCIDALSVRVADRKIPALQSAWGRRSRWTGSVEYSLHFVALRRRDCHGIHLRRLHDRRDWRGLRESVGFGSVFSWALFWNAIAVAIVFRPIFGRIEWIFKSLLILLSISFMGTAIWVGSNPKGVLQGTLAFKLPEKSGPYGSLLIAIGMIGAVGGSLMNLVYPYFLDKKGWNRPKHRLAQTYDFLLGVIVMIIINLSI